MMSASDAINLRNAKFRLDYSFCITPFSVCFHFDADTAASNHRRALKAQKEEATAALIRAQEEKTEERNRIMAEREVKQQSRYVSMYVTDSVELPGAL